MHRRQFINAAAGALLVPSGLAHARRQEVPVATPAATPQHHGRPRPIVLGDGIELIDYRIYPSQDVPRIIGEISSTRDEMVDSPVVSITFPELGEEGLAYATPLLPVMRPGESNMIFGVLPESVDADEMLQSASFRVCEAVGAGRHTELNLPHEWGFLDVVEEKSAGSQHLSGNIHNGGSTFATAPIIQGLVRDAADRYVGTTIRLHLGDMYADSARPFSVWAASTVPIPANPYPMLDNSMSYSTTLKAAIVGFVTQPGCSSALT